MRMLIRKHYPKILLSLSGLILLLRACFGFCWSDESFYYSIAYRFLQGDVPFLEEWYPTQLNSIFLLPFVALFRLITGSNNGILLTFRILYVLVSTAVAFMVFFVLSKETRRTVALFSALLFLYYTHLNIITFSYYAVSVLSAVVSFLCILHFLQMRDAGKSAGRFLLYGGASYAVLVLSMPLMAIVYFLAAAFLLLLHAGSVMPFVSGKCQKQIKALQLPHLLLHHLYGILAIAFPFCLYLFSRLSPSALLQSLPFVLSDEEHDETTLYVALRNCFQNLSDTFGRIVYICFLLIFLAIVIAVLKHFTKLKVRTGIIAKCRIVLVFADVIAFFCLFTGCIGHTGYVQIALVLFALPLFFLQDKPNIRLFVLFVLPGACLSYCYTYTSSGFSVYTEAIGFAVACIVAPAMILGCAEDILHWSGDKPDQKMRLLLYAPLYAVILSALILTITLRLVNIYRDDAISRLTCRIPDGPAAGILTTPEHLTDYESVLSVLQSDCTMAGYPDGTHDQILFSKLLPWGYLATDMHCASFSSWRSSMDSGELKNYYELHPDKYPDVILLLNDAIGSYETCGDVEADPVPNANDVDGHLYQYIRDQQFTEKSVPCGTLYVRP